MRRIRFHDFVLDVEQRQLVGPGEAVVALTPRHFDALLFFVERPGQLLDKDMLLAALWPGLVVEENSLSQTISALRRALGDDAQQGRFIQTVPKRGFRFVAPVTALPEAAAAPDASASSSRDTAEPANLGAAAAAASPGDGPASKRRRLLGVAALGTAVIAAGAGAWWWRAGSGTAAGSAAAAPTTLAILPFKPLAATARDELLEVGMADSLIARLSNLPGVAVRSIGSVRRFAGAEQDPMRAARDLNVAWIVDGSVQRVGGQVRVTARLLNTTSGEAAWSGRFDEQFTGVFDLQDTISGKVAQVLAPHLERRGRHRLNGAGGTRNVDAYQLYLAARRQAEGIRTAGLIRSMGLYREAIALDPDYALAYAGLGESHRRMIFGADGEPKATLAEARRNAQRAVEIDPELAEGHAGLGWVRFWHDWDWPGAEATFRRAIQLNPSEVNAHFGLSQLLEVLGRDDEATEQQRIAREIDPMSLILLTLEVGSLFSAGKRDEAQQRLQRVFDIEPDFWVAHLAQGGMQWAQGQTTDAIRSVEQADRLAEGSSQATAALGFMLAKAGHRDRAQQLLARLTDAARQRYVPPTSIGLIHCGLGNQSAAMDALDLGWTARDVRMTLVRSDPRWALVHDDPRYAALMRRMKLV
jgi:DNA-binding winged helix-turn-helix (wHTH) protein/TolB-like protein/tetratricopeptide (TPR) repeat protein